LHGATALIVNGLVASSAALMEDHHDEQRLGDTTPGISNNFRNVPGSTLVRFFDVEGAGIGITFAVPRMQQTRLFLVEASQRVQTFLLTTSP
jgi:hypothetical protein